MSFASSRGALSAFTVATTLACVLPMIGATRNPPVKVGGEVLVNNFTSHGQYYPHAVRLRDKKWVVVWPSNAQDGSGWGVYMQMYNADRTKYGGEVQVHTTAWANQNFPRVAAARDNTFVVTWYDGDSNDNKVQSRRFSSSGTKLGAEFTVNAVLGNALYPDVTYLKNGDVVFCWQFELGPGQSRRTMIRRFASNFSPLSGDIEVNTDPAQLAQNWPRIASLSGGGFVVVYDGHYTGSDQGEIKGQLYTASAEKMGPAFQINTNTVGNQQLPEVAGFPDGSFVVTWGTPSKGSSARHYAADGTPLADELLVHPKAQSLSAAMLHDNSFVFCWSGDLYTGADVFIQHYDASFNNFGSEVAVNTYVMSTYSATTVAASWDDGEFAVFYGSVGFASSSSQFDVVGNGKIIDIKVTGVVSNDVFGSVYFTDDSSVAAAAVFAGLVADGESGTVTVKCSGPKPSFTSASANGVTTQAYPSSWPSSFTFDLGGETQAPPPPAPLRCFHEPCALGKCHVQGTSFDIIVKGVASNNVWGTEAFSDDSWVGAAAVHQGVLEAGSIGSVTVSCTGARTNLTGSSRNGVISNSFGLWQFTYVVHAGPPAVTAPTADVCVGACLEGNCPENRELFLRVYGMTSGYLWGGSALYTADTTVSAAAVHAGLVTAGSTGIVKATCSGSQDSFTGSSQNGVTTASFGPWSESFTLSVGTTMPTVTCGAGEQCLKDECTVKGRVIKVSVTGSTHSATQFWGDNTRFAGDSPLSHAAVHAGLITDGQASVLYVSCQGPHDSFAGSTANGVTSTDWNKYWPGSFTLSSTL